MDLRSDKRQKTQRERGSMSEGVGEAQQPRQRGIESLPAAHEHERPTSTERMMEEICEWRNLKEAIAQVKANKGSAGIDGITVDELPDYRELEVIRKQLLNGTYKPQPVRRVEIPKPDGGIRKLGIPTAMDRVVQQAVMQVLQKQWEPTFSDSSFGFRPGRSAHQAVAQAQQYVAGGYGWVVDLDLEKFFDRVNHDKLMGQIAKRIGDKRLLKLIRAFLEAGVMENGLVSPSVEGTPQGGPLSPLLSNVVLDELDRELERRGHRFVRYADDCNIYVRSEQAGQRVMESVKRFITKRLKLKVNEQKSAVARPQVRKFLGFSFSNGPEIRRSIAPKAIERFKARIRDITHGGRSHNLEQTMSILAPYIQGWRGYFGFCETPGVLIDLTKWVRRRLRAALWRQWRTSRRRRTMLLRLGVRGALAKSTAASRQGPWPIAHTKALSIALSNEYFRSRGLPSLFGRC
jgi:RNA-directed DNA polymerase